MPSSLPIGPYKEIPVRNGNMAPFYVIPFDKNGRCKGPKTREHLINSVAQDGFSNIFLFSHGWNNTWGDAVENYEKFISNFQHVKPANSPLDAPDYKPVLIGITWPSTSLVMPWERGPGIQSATPNARPPDFDHQVRDQQDELDVVAELLPEEDVDEFYRIASSDQSMSQLDAVKLANMLAPLYGQVEDPIDSDDDTPTPDELIEFWKGPLMDAKSSTMNGAGAAAPAPAGIFDSLPDPRSPIRVFTVWKMKDRAGKVGATGVAKLLGDLLQASSTSKTHLIGHSFGSKVLLSAVSFANLPRPVTSALLLQPAINAHCFSANVVGKGFAGGYRPTLEQIEQPILSTYSSKDWPLTYTFHLALRGKGDLGETQIKNINAPSEFAALGGFGPQGLTGDDYAPLDIKPIGDVYPLNGSTPEVYGIRSDSAIGGHSEVVNEATAWALYCQVTA